MRQLAGSQAVAHIEALAHRVGRLDMVEPTVRGIVTAVRQEGDGALRRLAEQWDDLKKEESIRVAEKELKATLKAVPPDLVKALREAAAKIRRFAEWQMPKSWMRGQGGVRAGQIVRPLQSVGCYVPGGRYPLPSTLLMTVIPAQVAGVERIVVVSPQPRVETLAAAALLGVKEFYRIGGAQAVAALAYGTKSLPPVNKIVGPGNLYVTAAKKLVAFDCAIDFLAGPTEALIVQHSGRPDFIASDLVAQAEHDPEAVCLFITTSAALAKKVEKEITLQAENNEIARASLQENGVILLASSRSQAMQWANQIASEHLTVEERDLPLVRNAGSVFATAHSAQAAGDYVVGPNHVLPTAGTARSRGGLTVLDFVKVITVQQVTSQGIRRVGPAAIRLAEAEGLAAHAESLRLRVRHA
jgi:histidinol dehydrogenase